MISELEQHVLESIARRENIRFARVSSTVIEQGDALGAVVVSLNPAPDSKWEVDVQLEGQDE